LKNVGLEQKKKKSLNHLIDYKQCIIPPILITEYFF
jgi:hypothetical protein